MARLPDIWRDTERMMRPNSDFWRPFLREFDDMFSNMMNLRSPMTHEFFPACDYQEKDDKIMITMDVPGIDRKNISVELQGNQLVVTGERRDERQEEQSGRHYSERHYGSFQRIVNLPEGVKSEDVDAKCADGVLTLSIRKPSISAANRIEIGEGRAEPLTEGKEKEKKAMKGSSASEARPPRRPEPDSSIPVTH